jgi:Protein of unknown function (DUF4232)
VTKALLSALVLCALAAGCNGGAQEAGPVPTSSQGSRSTNSTSTGDDASNAAATSTAPSTPLCASATSAIRVQSQEGAAGTIRTVWRLENTSGAECRSFGYPGMDFRSSGVWEDVRVHRGGGYRDTTEPPSRVVVPAGGSLYFVSYWTDVTDQSGACKDFDRVKITLPDNFHSKQVASSGCVNPDRVSVGPVVASPPSL